MRYLALLEGGANDDAAKTRKSRLGIRPFPEALLSATRDSPLAGDALPALPINRRDATPSSTDNAIAPSVARSRAQSFVADALDIAISAHIRQCGASLFKYIKHDGGSLACRHYFHCAGNLLYYEFEERHAAPRNIYMQGRQLNAEVSIGRTTANGRRCRVVLPRAHPYEGPTNPHAAWPFSR